MRSYVSLAAAVALAGGVLIGAQSAQALTFGFTNLTENNTINNPDLSGQLFVDVTDHGNDQVAFTFRNEVGFQSTINAIYFDDGTLLGIATIETSGVPVAYSQGAAPPDLPGGNDASPPFVTTAGFLADADNPAPTHGVNASGEWVRIIFNLIDNQTYADTIAALLAGGVAGGLRIGLHMIDFVGGGSDSYLNNPTPIPLPAGLVLLLSGLAGVGFLGRYKARRRETAAA